MSSHKAGVICAGGGWSSQVGNMIGSIHRLQAQSAHRPLFEIQDLDIAEGETVVVGGDVACIKIETIEAFPLAVHLHTAITGW